jgi:hypothetical protein
MMRRKHGMRCYAYMLPCICGGGYMHMRRIHAYDEEDTCI